VPAAPLLLGYAGLLPFIWAALLILDLDRHVAPFLPDVLTSWLPGNGRLIMVRYGGIILPFMSGVLWGFATRAGGAKAAAAYVLSVIPALWWFFLPGTGVNSALINLAFGFAGILLLDMFYQAWGLTPNWWVSLRFQLTAIVLICLAIGIFL
jgi:hypothetical protein